MELVRKESYILLMDIDNVERNLWYGFNSFLIYVKYLLVKKKMFLLIKSVDKLCL